MSESKKPVLLCVVCSKPIVGKFATEEEGRRLHVECIPCGESAEEFEADVKENEKRYAGIMQCEGCGQDKYQIATTGPAEKPLFECPLCDGNLPVEKMFTKAEWNIRQFRARHEAIDRIVLAIARTENTACADGSPAYGCLWPAGPKRLNEIAIILHDSNLARRRVEAEKLIGGAK